MLEVGEVFPFIRYVSAAEVRGGAATPNDKTYALLKMDDKTLVVPSISVRLVEQRDIPAAAMAYRQIVQQSRDQAAKFMQDANEALQLYKGLQELTGRGGGAGGLGTGLSKNDRFRMLSVLREAKIISSIRHAEQMSDAEITRLYQQALEQQRLRNIENELRRLKQ